jgi:hypothetical protein
VAAAHQILADLLTYRGSNENEDIYADALKKAVFQVAHRAPSDDAMRRALPRLMKEFRNHRRRPANFLKHAERDATEVLDPDTMGTDDLLLEACTIYCRLGLPATPEMSAFGRWHLAMYPLQEEDRIVTAVGDVSTLSRNEQLEFGAFLLSLLKQDQESSAADN